MKKRKGAKGGFLLRFPENGKLKTQLLKIADKQDRSLNYIIIQLLSNKVK